MNAARNSCSPAGEHPEMRLGEGAEVHKTQGFVPLPPSAGVCRPSKIQASPALHLSSAHPACRSSRHNPHRNQADGSPRLCSHRCAADHCELLSYCDVIGFGRVTCPTARDAIVSAAATYFSAAAAKYQNVRYVVESFPKSSVGNSSSAARKSTPRMSRTVFEYSVRFNRRTVTRPGSGFASRSALSNSPSRYATIASIFGCAGRGIPFGGISPERTFCNIFSQAARFEATVGRRGKLGKVNAARKQSRVMASHARLAEDRFHIPVKSRLVRRGKEQ